MSIARVVVAAPASGHGKTTVATGLLAAFAARGLVVSPHKVGPDYIDPGYHGLAAGRPGRNLDPYLCGEDLIAPLFLHGAQTPTTADLAVVEGVMGLFDGASGHGELASTAQVAKLLRAPVVLVVDVTAQGRSVAALVHGFATFDPAIRIGGVILNRVGSPRHETIAREALEDVGVPVLGALRRDDAVATPSRHLGLVPAAERSVESLETVRALGALVAAAVDLDAVLDLARSAPTLDCEPWNPASVVGNPVPSRPRIAIAAGAAFTFSYAETAELLTAAGAEVVPFDPMRDEALPEATGAVVMGGGFPEVHASSLSANASMRRAVLAHFAAGGAIVAECAGLLYLAQSLDGAPMCRVLDVEAQMSTRLTLGYRDAVAASDSILAVVGERIRGHEFHRTVVAPRASAVPAWHWAGAPGPEGFTSRRLHASYLHVHWAGFPSMAHRLVAAAAA